MITHDPDSVHEWYSSGMLNNQVVEIVVSSTLKTQSTKLSKLDPGSLCNNSPISLFWKPDTGMRRRISETPPGVFEQTADTPQ
ncbi:hypothetical protein J1614_009115 [Plenodomus biglobosus]|nr:hypothetical protein J1614_009115 [Plenodomus biglobosus]